MLPHYFASEIAPCPIISAKPKSSGQTITMNHMNLLSTPPGPRVSSFTATQMKSNRMGWEMGAFLAPPLRCGSQETAPQQGEMMNNVIFQHYRNARNWGDSWLFTTKMLLQGHLLTDKKYKQALKNILGETHER